MDSIPEGTTLIARILPNFVWRLLSPINVQETRTCDNVSILGRIIVLLRCVS